MSPGIYSNRGRTDLDFVFETYQNAVEKAAEERMGVVQTQYKAGGTPAPLLQGYARALGDVVRAANELARKAQESAQVAVDALQKIEGAPPGKRAVATPGGYEKPIGFHVASDGEMARFRRRRRY